MKKWAEYLRHTFHKRHTDDQQAHEIMFNIANYYRLANQNHNEVSPNTSQNDHHQSLQINAGEGVEKKDPSYTVGKNVNLYRDYGEQYGGSLKKLKTKLPCDTVIALLGIQLDKLYFEKNMHPIAAQQPNVHLAT